MSINIGSQSGKLQGTAVIRDKDGNIKSHITFESTETVDEARAKELTQQLLGDKENDD